MTSRFLQIHTLTSYPGVLLNRDDAGLAKRLPFGGVERLRISSQCLKRHWRVFDGEHALSELGVPGSVRSRQTFQKLIFEPLCAEGIAADVAAAGVSALQAGMYEKKADGDGDGTAKPRKKGSKGATSVADGEPVAPNFETSELLVLGKPEVEYILGFTREACLSASSPTEVAALIAKKIKGEFRKNIHALKRASGLDAALFGRMTTSDLLSRGDAAVHVAHAITVHAAATENDYFTAVDDLPGAGSAHINSTELTSGLYYGYVVIDLPLLVSNLEGCDRKGWEKADRSLSASVASHLVHLVATVSPGAKLGATAPYANAQLVFAELGNAQPRSLADAFLEPVAERPNLAQNAFQALGKHMTELDRMYGPSTKRKLAALHAPAGLCDAMKTGSTVSLAELAKWAENSIREG